MYPVSAAYKTAVSATSRTWHSRIKITRAAQVINLTDADLKLGGLKFNEAVLASDKIALGDAVMSDIEFTILDADGIYATTDFDGAVVEPDVGLELVHPVNQVETATVAGTVTANGNASVVVTAAGMTGSPKTKAVAVVKEDTAEQVAGKIRVALAADTAVTALFTVSGWGAAIILTKITATANDSTLNVSITKGTSTGITAAPTSANTAAGVAAVIEWVPLGKYNIDEYTKPFRAVNICALDNLLKFERPFSEISVAFPCSTVTLLNTVCSQCGVTLATTSFTNSGYVINARPTDELSCRDVVGFCAQIAARFARCNRAGQLELAWFKNPGGSATKDFATTPDNRFNFKIAGESIAITGVTFETDTEMLISGTDAYTVDISSNTLIQHDIETLLNSIYAAVNGFVYVPYSGEWVGDPAVQAGDLVEHTDRDSNVHRSVIGKIAYRYRGKSTIEIGSVSKNKKGYMTSSEKQYRTLKKRVEDKQIQLDALDQAVLNGTTLIAGALGGHSIVGTGVYEGNYFIADNADITAAVKVWRGNLGGFGYSSSGVNGPYTAGISADNSIWASLVTADMMKTGLLASLNGTSYFDLDTGDLYSENATLNGLFTSNGHRTYCAVGDQGWAGSVWGIGIRSNMQGMFFADNSVAVDDLDFSPLSFGNLEGLIGLEDAYWGSGALAGTRYALKSKHPIHITTGEDIQAYSVYGMDFTAVGGDISLYAKDDFDVDILNNISLEASGDISLFGYENIHLGTYNGYIYADSDIRMPNGNYLRGKNTAGTTYFELVGVDTDNRPKFGNQYMNCRVDAYEDIRFYIGGVQVGKINSTGWHGP